MQEQNGKEKNAGIKKYNYIVLSVLIAIVFPLILVLFTIYNERSYGILSTIIIILACVPFFMNYEMKKPKAREWIPLVVMASLAAIGRILFAAVPFFKPTSAIIIITASVFGPIEGFLTGALAAISSNLFFGQGPWTPWQMFSWGFIGFISGILFKKNILKEGISLYIFGGLCGYIFGWIMNLWTALSFTANLNSGTFFSLYISSFVPDTIHSISTIFFLKVLFESWRKRLMRIKVKFNIN